jgi:N-acetyl-gamma-glutamyl-phosphate reductase
MKPHAMGQDEPVKVGIAGATGYAGQELVRLLARHPGVAITAAMGSSATSTPRALPALAHLWSGHVVPLDVELLASGTDAVFLALPEEASAALAPQLLARGRRVFDLSGAFRLRDENARARWYPHTKQLPEGTSYGLTEHARQSVASARLVSCPGCYPTAAALAIKPLVSAGLVAGDIVIDAKSGVSGAGKTPTERTHFSEAHGSVSAYKVFAHRHAAEIEQEVGRPVTFVPHLVPLDRGILETIYVRVPPGTTDATIAAAYAAAYGGSCFVRITGPTLPTIRQVAWSNFCDIGWALDEPTNRLVVVSVIDNLVKGAAGQAVQNFNVAYGFNERTGLV